MDPDASPSGTSGSSDKPLLLELGRRVLRRDVGRVVDLTEGLLQGTRHLDERRRVDFADLTEDLCDDVVAELGFEESLLWPLLEQHAPEALPYATLRERREDLRALVADARRTTRAVVTQLAHRPATLATAEDHRRVELLAAAWRSLSDGLTAFVDPSARETAELVTERIPDEQWATVLDAVREGLTDPRGAGARVVEVATPEEMERLRDQLGPRPLTGWTRHGRRRRSKEASVFGPR
ncbi:hypothetical protein [Actinomycetospora termitidis]|uniref:Uncharacterized protein n=1 Tax=Actinomycetospora termitidis TaxID=3053470 RepID=A0ABT7M641_9PSEU|nr:hypothetical protein [Actinomycetospora sp. Odt1-22]MDL5156145.1 hypothetical protein [Actinomycetospora sp. Odt1-22]